MNGTLVSVQSIAYPSANIGTLGLATAYAEALAVGAVGEIVPLGPLGQGTNFLQANFTPPIGGIQDQILLLVSSDNFVKDVAVAWVLTSGDKSTQLQLITGYVRTWRTIVTPGATGSASCSVSVIQANGVVVSSFSPFTSGSSGPIHVTTGNSPYVAAGPLYPTTFIVDVGSVIDVSGPLAGLILCSVSATVNGTVRCDGTPGQAGAAGGAGGTNAGLTGNNSEPGQDGTSAPGVNASGSTVGGGNGGNGGNGSGGHPGGAASIDVAYPLPQDPISLLAFVSPGAGITAVAVAGASGGGDGVHSGGGSGGAAGPITIGAPIVTLGATAVFQAVGGNGGAGDPAGTTGGGGGGGGGTASVIAGTLSNAGATVNTAGGVGGAGTGGGAHNGANGSPGTPTLNVVIV